MAEETRVDVVLVGAGIMSATLGTLLHALDPTLTIHIYERLDQTAAESSAAWNNAGTGHSAFCELNYTPRKPNGQIDVNKARRIAEQFELSKQFWAALVAAGDLPAPSQFISPIPHISFVWGDDDVRFLSARYDALTRSPLFEGMQFTKGQGHIENWIPLVMEGRRGDEPVAATKMDGGTDVNFGALTRHLVSRLAGRDVAELHLNHEVRGLERTDDGWHVDVYNRDQGTTRGLRAGFVFIGAGGGALKLLEASGVPEGRGYGGFPVSGQWLRCTNRAVIERHHAKVYGKAQVGAPPMSVPHLDTRRIGGQRELLFGPYAGFSTKFLKQGSYADLFRSLGFDNIVPMLAAGAGNLDLTRYLVGQALLAPEDRVATLRRYLPAAVDEDWDLEIAGQRVQIIKSDGQGGGVLQFGTEIVTSEDCSLAALLGASPGASTAVAIMLDLLGRCFSERMLTPEWSATLRRLVPSFGRSLHANPKLCARMRAASNAQLGIA